MTFCASEARIYDKKDKLVGSILVRGGLYKTMTNIPRAYAAEETPITVTLD